MIGKTLSHYKIIEKLGSGGMGIVYKAQDLKLDRFVALKFLPPHLTTSEEEKQRFIHEAKAASALDHNNICAVHEIDETEDGQLFISMAYYEGDTLHKKIQDKPLPLEEAIVIAIQIAQGLAKAHEKGIVHRDIKPANIILTNDGVVKILDFGLAKLSTQTKLTKEGSTVGTISYMSPEQTRGEQVDHKTDIWSLGVILYEMLTGQLPFKGDYDQAVIYSILNDGYLPISEINNKIPSDLETIINEALDKKPDNRYQNLLQFTKELKQIQQSLDPRFSHGRMSSTRTRRLQSRKIKFVGIIFTILFIIFFISFYWDNFNRLIGRLDIPEEKHIAVLPFAHIGQDLSKEPFCEGLFETLVSKLSQLEYYQKALWVVPAAEIREHKIMSPTDVKRKFKKVYLAVSGSIQFDQNECRLTMNLIDLKAMRQIESRVKNYHLSDLFQLQDDIVIQLILMLKEEINPQNHQVLMEGGTRNSHAYDYYLRGQGYLSQSQDVNDIDKSIELFLKATKLDTTYALAYSGLAAAFWKKYMETKENQWVDSARYYCASAIQLTDRLAANHITLGMIKLGSGQYTEAIEEYKLALDLDPVNADAYMGLAKAYSELGEIALAEETFKKAISLKPGYWRYYSILGVFYFRQGRYQEAIEQFTQSALLTPENTKVLNNLGGVYTQIGNNKEAIKTFKKSLEIKASASGYSNLGAVYWYEKDYQNAAAAFEKAVNLRSNDYRLWGNLASAYSRIPNMRDKKVSAYKSAIKFAQKALLVNPKNQEILADIAGFYASIEDRPMASQYIQKIVNSDPTSVEIYFRLADAYEILGEREKAITWIGKALRNGYPLELIKSNANLNDLCADEQFTKLISDLEKPK